MIGVLLLLMVEGIGLALAASDGRAVTARWQRLGGLIALALLAVAWTIGLRAAPGSGAVPGTLPAAGLLPGGEVRVPLALLAVATGAAIAQLTLAQLGWRQWQRAAAGLVVLAAGAAACAAIRQTLGVAAEQMGLAGAAGLAGDATAATWGNSDAATWLNAAAATLLAGGIVGGFLMTMLLGHAYLTAGNEMTQRPFVRLVMLMGALIAARALQSGLTALWPWWSGGPGAGMIPGGQAWTMMMIVARYLVGLAVPALFTWMTYDCVKRRANQSATGILYVAGVLVIIGEGVALALMGATGKTF